MDKAKLGKFGEDVASERLCGMGYKIIERNYSCRGGEIDIIAENAEYIVFAEVKLRKDAFFAEAREFVTPAKQARIRQTAELWLSTHENEKQPRFDVIEVYAPNGKSGAITVNHIEDAFM
jgi:putative endonuclease